MNDALPPRWPGTHKCAEALLRVAHETFRHYSSTAFLFTAGHRHGRRRGNEQAREREEKNDHDDHDDHDDKGHDDSSDSSEDDDDDDDDDDDESASGGDSAAAGRKSEFFAKELAVVFVDIPRMLGSSAGQLRLSASLFNRTAKAACAWRSEKDAKEAKESKEAEDEAETATTMAERYRKRNNEELVHVRYEYARELEHVVLGASFSHCRTLSNSVVCSPGVSCYAPSYHATHSLTD